MKGVSYDKRRNKYRATYYNKGRRDTKEFDTEQAAFIHYLALTAYYGGIEIVQVRPIKKETSDDSNTKDRIL